MTTLFREDTQKMFVRVHATLTAKAKAMFGDLVQDAMIVSISEGAYRTRDRALLDLDRAQQFHMDDDEAGMIDLQACDILLRFCNGKVVRVQASEWGALEAVTHAFEEIKA